MPKQSDKTTSRIAERRAANKAAGGAHINTAISPEAARALAKLRETMGMRQAVERGLILLAETIPDE